MALQLPQMDRLAGVGLQALDRLSMVPAPDYRPGTALGGDRAVRSGMQDDGRRSAGMGTQPRDFASFAEQRGLQSFGGGPGGRQLGSQDTTYGRQINDPTGGVNQPGLQGLLGTGNTTGTNPPGVVGSLGGEWATVDQWNDPISKAAAKWGVDPARLKAHMRIESGGDPNAVQVNPTYGNTYGLMQINPAIWDGTLKANGINMYTPEGNIEAAAFILQDNYKRYGSWDAASSAFFLGNPNWQGGDTVNGTSGQTYQQTLNSYIQQASAGGLSANQQFRNAYQSPQGAATASAVLNAAKQYVGTPYVWGAIPGKGQTPTGWDCSGMTYWLDQNFGTGTLPMGSHYQYGWAKQTGNLHGADQLQPGDIIYFDTGDRSGGGANIPGQEQGSHVGIFIGGDQFIHAANPSVGTIVSSLSQYSQMYQFLGGSSMSWSGGGSAANPTGAGASPANQALRRAFTGYGRGYEQTLSQFAF